MSKLIAEVIAVYIPLLYSHLIDTTVCLDQCSGFIYCQKCAQTAQSSLNLLDIWADVCHWIDTYLSRCSRGDSILLKGDCDALAPHPTDKQYRENDEAALCHE